MTTQPLRNSSQDRVPPRSTRPATWSNVQFPVEPNSTRTGGGRHLPGCLEQLRVPLHGAKCRFRQPPAPPRPGTPGTAPSGRIGTCSADAGVYSVRLEHSQRSRGHEASVAHRYPRTGDLDIPGSWGSGAAPWVDGRAITRSVPGRRARQPTNGPSGCRSHDAGSYPVEAHRWLVRPTPCGRHPT